MNDNSAPRRSRVIRLLQDLIRTRSDNPGVGEAGVVDVLATVLASTADELEVVEYVPGRPNLIARYGACSGDRPTLLLTASTDTVTAQNDGWTNPPFAAVIDRGEVWGRGAADMKGGIAALVESVLDYHETDRPGGNDILLAFASDGERGGRSGWQQLSQRPGWPPITGAVVAAPTSLIPHRRERGVAWLTIDIEGRAAPASCAADGASAILAALDLIARLPAAAGKLLGGDDAGGVAVCVGRIDGGDRVNLVPARCRVEVDLRLPPGAPALPEAALESLIASCAPRGVRVATEVALHAGSSQTASSDPFWQQVQRITGAEVRTVAAVDPVYQGPTDARFLRDRLAPATVVWGPGDQNRAHRDNERVKVSEIERAVRLYRNLLTAQL